MRHLKILRAVVGSAGLIACIGLLASQARADIVELYPAPAIVDDSGDAPIAADARQSSAPLVTLGQTHRGSAADDAPRAPGSRLMRRLRELLDKPQVARPAD